MVLLRRFGVVAALMFWQGGFTFYAAVVVPLGTSLHGAVEQGFLTRLVTNCLNWSGLVCLMVLAAELLTSNDPSRYRLWLRRLCWAGLALSLVGLFVLHPRLDALLDPEQSRVLNRSLFRPRHRLYLWVSTVQWLITLVYLLCTLLAWRGEDYVAGTYKRTAAELEKAQKGPAADVFGVAQSPKPPFSGTFCIVISSLQAARGVQEKMEFLLSDLNNLCISVLL